MRKIAPPGCDVLPATLGGSGWVPRAASHLQEVAAGVPWRRCGVCSEVAPLREVMLSWPGEELRFDAAPDRFLMLDYVDLPAMQRQAEGIVAFYEAHGIRVHLYRAATLPPPNLIFMRDLFCMTPEGAVLARMAAQQRAGEERHAALALSQIGVPLLGTPREAATFEGADALWLDEKTVLVGSGRRTNLAGVRFLREVLSRQGVTVVAVKLPAGVQHLLGVVNLVDKNLAVVQRDRVTPSLRKALRERDIALLELDPTDEVVHGRAMNFVTLAPRVVVMTAACPQTRRLLERAGVQCHEAEVDQYLRAAGGLGCLTGIVLRAQDTGRMAM